MASAFPVLYGNLDALAMELMVMAVTHRDVLNVEDNQWRPIQLSNRRGSFDWLLLLLVRGIRLLRCIVVVIGEVDLVELTRRWCSRLAL